MKIKLLVAPVIVMLGVSMGGCSTAPVQTAYGPMPQYCTQNNAATGAVVGTLLGAAIGGAIGGGRGAAIGAGSGLVLGGLTGAQADAQCRQLAYQRAMEMAAAQEAAARAAGRRVAYAPIEYVTPTDGRRHVIRPLSSRTNPATGKTCRRMQEINYSPDGSPQAGGSTEVCG